MEGITTILTDIEGTTTPISFVRKNLFPYAAKKITEFVQSNWDVPEVIQDIEDLKETIEAEVLYMHDKTMLMRAVTEPKNIPAEQGAKAVGHFLEWLIKKDRKAKPLKSLQGKLWKEGYEQLDIHGHLFREVAPCLREWNAMGKNLYIYSSGSVQAQQLMFRYSIEGNLCPLLSGYFDLNIGDKRDPSSYMRILAAIDEEPHHVCFLTDIYEEAVAAHEAGMKVLISVRKGNAPLPSDCPFPIFRSFAQVEDVLAGREPADVHEEEEEEEEEEKKGGVYGTKRMAKTTEDIEKDAKKPKEEERFNVE